MEWLKKGLIYKSPFDGSWRDNSALTPTPFRLNDDVIRVFCSFRDPNGIGRIGYVDLLSDYPKEVLSISDSPVLDIGKPGMFDDNGVILGDIIRMKNEVFMYYIGFQKTSNVKFLAYTGLAISNDNGSSFIRYRETPIMDRDKNGLFIKAIHSIIYEDGVFKAWFAAGNSWEIINDKPYPSYNICYADSKDGFHFSNELTVIDFSADNNEYRIGRPRVYKIGHSYIMCFTYGTIDGQYRAGFAESNDGINWVRKDSKLGINLSNTGWDSKHLCYTSYFKIRNNTYLFYNGNNMGFDGFGYAKGLNS